MTKEEYLIKYYIKPKDKSNLSNSEKRKLSIAIKKAKSIPLQYIVGNTNFFGYTYKVNKNVLIPRFETEYLVENTIKYIKKIFDNKISIVDVGTGSGCIGITLKKELNADVTLTDISKRALNVAKENCLGLEIKLLQGNMLKPLIKSNLKFDVLISNPPYISYDEKIMPIVYQNEPHKALFAKNKGLYFYEEILKNASKVLKEKFLIAFEIGCNQAQDISNLSKKYLKNVKIDIKKDLQERERMIFIYND